MEMENNQEIYSLPLNKKSEMKLFMHMLALIMIIMFTVFTFLPLGNDIADYLARLAFLFCSLFFLYGWLFVGVLKRMRLRLTNEYIEFRTPFGKKIAKWSEICGVKVFKKSYNTFIGLVLKEEIRREKEKRSLWVKINNIFEGAFYIKIPLSSFKDIDVEKLYLTISSQIKEYDKVVMKSDEDVDANEIH